MHHFASAAAITLVAFAPFAPSVQQQAEHGVRPTVSPDGKYVAFSANRGDGSDLYVIAANGTGERRLAHDAAAEGKPYWSADGKQLTFAIFARDTSMLYSINVDGTGRRTIGIVAGRNPILLRNGKRALYASGGWTMTPAPTSATSG